MGKKRNSQQHLQQSMGQMVSRAALAQLGPEIEKLVRAYVSHLGQQLATQQASTLETLFARVVVLESIVMEKLGYTAEDLTTKVAEIEDEKESLTKVEEVQENDVVRLEIKTKTKDQTEFQGGSRLKIYKTGSGETIGKELESALIGLKTGESKTIPFGKDQGLVAEVLINRISRPPAPQVLETEQAAETTEETQNAAEAQG